MAIASENSVTIVIRTWSFMIIFCFVGSAAGSCISYGHSCWGAHGKRNGGYNSAYLIPSKTMNDMQQGIPLLTKEQLLLPRLIGLPLISNKYKGRWNRLSKIKMNFPEYWKDGELNAHLISTESIRDQNNSKDVDEGKKKHTNDLQDISASTNDERKEIPEILLISNNENNQHTSKPQNMELFKFLSNMNGNFD